MLYHVNAHISIFVWFTNDIIFQRKKEVGKSFNSNFPYPVTYSFDFFIFIIFIYSINIFLIYD